MSELLGLRFEGLVLKLHLDLCLDWTSSSFESHGDDFRS